MARGYKKNTKAKSDGIIQIDTYNKWFNVVLIILCFFVLLAVRLQVNQATTGDEPAYLVMDYALVHNHDLNLKNVYVKREYLSFYPTPGLPPQGNPKLDSLSSKKIYSPHGIGLPLLLAPGFYLKGKTGAVFELVLIATLVVYLTWVWTKLVTNNRKIAYLASSLLVICYFFNGLVGYIYPDMVIAAVTLVILIMLEKYYKKTSHQLYIGFALGFLILLHFKNLDVVLPMLLVLTYKLWKSERKLPWVTGLVVLAFTAYYLVSLHHWFGVWNPSTVYGPSAGKLGGNPVKIVSAMLFDSNHGLLIYNPIMLLIPIGLPLWFRRNRESFMVTMVALVPSIAVLAVYTGWNGGAAPTDRYIIDFLPAFIPAVAFAIERLDAVWQRGVTVVLAITTFLISLDATMSRFPLISSPLLFVRSSLFTQIQRHTGLSLDRFLPTYTTQTDITTFVTRHGSVKVLVGYLVVAGLLACGVLLSRSGAKRLGGTEASSSSG